MKKIDYKTTYVALTADYLNVKAESFSTKKEMRDYLKTMNFSTRGKLDFDDVKMKTIVNVNGNMGANAIIAEHLSLNKGNRASMVFKIVQFSAFSGLIDEDEEVYYIDDRDIQASPNFKYFISNKDNIYKLDMRDGVARQLVLENDIRIKILGIRYYLVYLKTKIGDKYE